MRTSSWTNQRDPKSISSLPPVIWSACCLHLPSRRHPFCAYRRSNLKSWSPAFAAHSSLATVQCMTVSSVFLCSCSAPYVWYAWAFCQVMSLREVCVQFSKAVSMVRFIRGCNTLSYRNRFFPSPMVVGVRSFLDFSCWSFLDFSWPLSSLCPTVIGEVDNVAMSASGASRSSRFLNKSCSTHSCLASIIWHWMSWTRFFCSEYASSAVNTLRFHAPGAPKKGDILSKTKLIAHSLP